MGNCLRIIDILRTATTATETSENDDTTLLDPGNYGENLQIPNSSGESSDESPLFFLIA